MLLVYTPWHVISALLVFLTGVVLSIAIGRRFETTAGRSLALYVWHSLLCLVYLWYVRIYGGDAITYYLKALIGGWEFEVGTGGVNYLTALIVQGLGLSLLGTFLVYNIFGAIGLLAFDACLRVATKDKAKGTRRLATLIVFLPSVSFWSAGLGKDALSFMATGLALWVALDLGRRALVMGVAVAVMLLVRPHVAGMMVLGLTVASLLDPRSSVTKRVLLGAVAVAVAAAMVPFALNYAGVGEGTDAKGLSDYVEARQGHNMQGGGAVDISSMSLPEKLFTYLFRPMLFEASSVFGLAAGIDNLILVYLFVMGGRNLLRRRRSGLGENRVFMWTYALMAWLILALTTANLGIALRQKWMFAPMLIFLFISVIGRPRKRFVAPAVPPMPYRNLRRP